jgi:hypothetical protein
MDLGAKAAVYYKGNLRNQRYNYFIASRTKDQLRSDVHKYTRNAFMLVAQWPIYQGAGVSVSSVQAEATRDAFTDFIWNRKV